jgi:hypothetical protein
VGKPRLHRARYQKGNPNFNSVFRLAQLTLFGALSTGAYRFDALDVQNPSFRDRLLAPYGYVRLSATTGDSHR